MLVIGMCICWYVLVSCRSWCWNLPVLCFVIKTSRNGSESFGSVSLLG